MSESKPQIGNWTEEQAQEAGYDFDEENGAVWASDDLRVEETDDGQKVVKGQMITAPIEGPDTDIGEGTDVRVWVNSYSYREDGEVKMNHVAMYSLVAPEGHIITDGDNGDSDNPEKAIEATKKSANLYFTHPERYSEK